METSVYKYILVPVIAIFGIIIIGAIINDALGIAGAATALFVAVGGFTFFAKFYNNRR